MNPLFSMFGPSQFQGPFGNINQVISEYNKFRQTLQGDPRQQVQDLLNSGRMTQDQFNQLSQMAQSFQTLLKR